MQACKEEACAAQGLVCRPRRGGGDGKEAEQRAEEGGAEEEEVCWEESMVQLGRGRGGSAAQEMWSSGAQLGEESGAVG